MSTQTSDSAAGLDPAAVEEWILALGLGAEPPPHFARAARTGIPAPQIVDGLVRQAQLAAVEAGLGATR